MVTTEPNGKAKPVVPEPIRPDKADSPVTESTPPEKAEAVPAKKPRWFRTTIIVLFGIAYAWDLFSALSNFIGKLDQLSGINEVRVLNGFSEIATPWIPLIANLILPVAVFALAVWFARRCNVGILALMLVSGLGVVASVSLSLIAYVVTIS